MSEKRELVLRKIPMFAPKILVIGASTGGPKALREFLTILGDIPQAVLITQHVSANFTDLLVSQLASVTNNNVIKAGHRMTIEPKTIYMTPGNYHLVVSQGGDKCLTKGILAPTGISDKPFITLTQDPPENFCRPAVDVMFRSVAKVYENQALGIILTGMGQDGLRGSQALIEAGSFVMAQDEESSVVWGMPGVVSMAGLCSAVLPLQELAQLTRNICKNPLQTNRKSQKNGEEK